MWTWLFFGIGTLLIAAVSWRSFRSGLSHGFFRFFAFEAILGLVLWNAHAWFADPFSPQHVVSWLLLIVSAFLAIQGFLLLKQIGRPDRSIDDLSRIGFEKTTHLVTSGVYRFIRHPLYASLLFLGLGAFLKNPTAWQIILVLLMAAFLYATARVEEQENLRNFGAEYHAYMGKTRMFIPFLF